MALPWLELQAQVAARVGEAEDVPNSIIPVGENDIPFFSQPIIENLLLEISNQMLREINPDTLEAIGSQAINTTIYTTNGQALTTGTIRVLTVSIRPSNTDVNYIGTQPMTPATFVQVQNADPTLISGWAVFNGGLYYIGFDARVVAIVEPSLAVWKSNPTPPILPDGSDEMRIDWCVKQLQIINFLPKGGI